MELKHVKALHNEVAILKKLTGASATASHPHRNILQLLGVYDDGKGVHGDCYLVTELMTGGTVVDWMLLGYEHGHENGGRAAGKTERDVAALMKQACDGLAHCHSRGIVHRDIKPENLLIASDHGHHHGTGTGPRLKIGDWGLATEIPRHHHRGPSLDQFCGTWEYMGPEMLHGRPYTQNLDVWAMGITIHFLVTGTQLFEMDEAGNMSEAAKARFATKVNKGLTKDTLARHSYAHVSRNCIDLLHKMLKPDQFQRASIQQLLKHGWLGGSGLSSSSTHPLPHDVASGISRWRASIKRGLDQKHGHSAI
jgi:serine/threonine protein kinase